MSVFLLVMTVLWNFLYFLIYIYVQKRGRGEVCKKKKKKKYVLTPTAGKPAIGLSYFSLSPLMM